MQVKNNNLKLLFHESVLVSYFYLSDKFDNVLSNDSFVFPENHLLAV